jgi:hypothetical protein
VGVELSLPQFVLLDEERDPEQAEQQAGRREKSRGRTEREQEGGKRGRGTTAIVRSAHGLHPVAERTLKGGM